MAMVITAFERSPDRGRGLARDMRVRWALEEVGQACEVRLVSFEAMKEAPHLALHPFGQIPTLEDGDLALFESGAIVLNLAERYEGLLPREASARGRAVSWLFAALNSVEPSILELETSRFFEASQPWHPARLPMVEGRVSVRLGQVSKALADREWLDGDFSAGDLMMASVLIRLKSSGLLNAFPNLVEYLARCEARPAYGRAFAAQLAVFQASEAGRPG
jgi:glutathione S-transferase